MFPRLRNRSCIAPFALCLATEKTTQALDLATIESRRYIVLHPNIPFCILKCFSWRSTFGLVQAAQFPVRVVLLLHAALLSLYLEQRSRGGQTRKMP
jgi:hypothetical protein